MVSLHVDGHPNPAANGVATYFFGTDRYGQSSAVGERFATLLLSEIVARTDLTDCGVHGKTWDLLTEMGCDLVQGWHLAKAMAIGELLPGMAYLVRRLLENTSNESFLKASFTAHARVEDLLRDPDERRWVESHVRPLVGLLQQQGHEVEITSRDYAQTVQLIESHGMTATVIGHHGGRSSAGKARQLFSRLQALRSWAKGQDFDLALAHGSHELTMTGRRLGIPSSTTFDYEWAWLQHQLGCRAWPSRPVDPTCATARRRIGTCPTLHASARAPWFRR